MGCCGKQDRKNARLCTLSDNTLQTALASAETSNLYPSFNLSDGYLTPQAAAGTTPGIVPWVTPLQAGDPFTLLQAIGSPYPASIFCAAVRKSSERCQPRAIF